MFINLEWNLDEALQVRFEEGFEIGFAKGFAEGFEIGFAEGLAEGFEIGFAEGLAEVCEKIAVKLIRHGKSFDEIQEYTELPLERIRELAEKNLDA